MYRSYLNLRLDQPIRHFLARKDFGNEMHWTKPGTGEAPPLREYRNCVRGWLAKRQRHRHRASKPST